MAAPKIKMTTPVVELKYINVVNPDGKFSPNNPKYQTSWVLPPKDGKALIAEIQEKMPGLKVPHSRDDDDNYVFKATQKKYIEWTKDGEKKSVQFSPVLLNADNSKYEGPEPWGGSTGEVAFILRETNGPQGKGLSLSLQGIRFHDVKVGSGEDSGGDPLFGNNTQNITAVPVEDMPEGDDDDIPFN